MPHAHLVAWLEDAYDIDDPNHDNLIDFVNKHFIAEIPRFEVEEFQNIHVSNGEPEFTEKYKWKAVEMVRMKHLLRMGWRNLFSSCAVVSVFCSGGK